MKPEKFTLQIRAILAPTPIFNLLSASDAVVLERIAKGAGKTNWYYCSGQTQCETIIGEFSPGSVVSFYFDRRIQYALYSLEVEFMVERIIFEMGEAIIGLLREDGLHIDFEIVTGNDELMIFGSKTTSTSHVFYGVFPARDNDGVRAVTITLPDIDGTVRAHPH